MDSTITIVTYRENATTTSAYYYISISTSQDKQRNGSFRKTPLPRAR